MKKIKTFCSVAAIVITSSVVRAQDLRPIFEASYAQEAKGNLSDAFQMVKSIADQETDPTKNYTLKMRLGYLKGLMKKYVEAAQWYGDAAKTMPDAVEPLIAQQSQYIAQGDWKKLLESSAAALKLDSKNYYARTRLAYAYYNLADYDAAAKEYAAVLKLYPLDLDVKSMLGWCYAMKKEKNQAQRVFTEVLAISALNTSAKGGMDYLQKI